MMGVVHPIIFFPLYESMKFYLKNNFEDPNSDKLSNKFVVLSTVCSKVVACAASYPPEVIRSRMMYEKIGVEGVKESMLSVI